MRRDRDPYLCGVSPVAHLVLAIRQAGQAIGLLASGAKDGITIISVLCLLRVALSYRPAILSTLVIDVHCLLIALLCTGFTETESAGYPSTGQP